MRTFSSHGLVIAYDDLGQGAPVVLVHGFAASRELNWKQPGWYDLLRDAGYRVAALDCRGHGESAKPYESEAYDSDEMAGDVLRMMDDAEIDRARLMGYSMGGMICANLLLYHADRFEAVVLGGIGAGAQQVHTDGDAVAGALEADDPDAITDPRGRAFRAFADSTSNDRQALAACMRRRRRPLDPDALARVTTPVLVVAGEKDDMVGDPVLLADAIPGAKALVLPERDHLTAVGDRRYKEAVLDFFASNGSGA